MVLAGAALVASSALAEQRSESAARQLAQQYLAAQQLAPATLTDLQLVSATKVRGAAKVRQQQITSVLDAPYYIYNNPAGGYVIVSGTTALDPVIASSDKGSIDFNSELPDGLRYWLGYAADAANYVEQHPEAAAPHPAKAPRRGIMPGITLQKPDYTKDVAPMLVNSKMGNIQWSQEAPFYDQCPTKNGRHCYTGCMATAMSQVLAYHQYPANYDWSEIRASYKGGAGSSYSRSEVARLNHEVGQALSMQYGTDQSGSVSTMYSRALRDNFGFNENVELINRDNYTYGEWMDIILNEFANNRPVIYDGTSNDGGHAFVIDGYRAKDGFVHVNWGWEGLSDGYYNIILLDPQETGIGAVLSSGFTTYQDMVVGIEPDRTKELNYYSPIQGYGMQGELVIGSGYAELAKGDRQGYISMQYMPNMKPEAFRGEFGALFINSEGQEVGRAKAGTITAAASTMSSNPHATLDGGYFTVPVLPDGVYRIYCYITDSQTGKTAVARTTIDKPNFMTMTQKDGRAFFEIAKHHPTGLQASKWSFETSEPKFGSTGLSVTVTNTGDEVEYGSFAFSIDVPGELSRNFYDEFHRFLPGQSETLTFPVTFTQYGEYTVRGFDLYRLNGGGQANIVEPQTIKFSVNRTVAELLAQLDSRVKEVQSILDKARLTGNYPDAACDALQKVIDEVKSAPQTSLDAAGINALLKKLDEALATFYKQLDAPKTYWGYVNGKEDQLTSGWCPGGTKPAYLAISIPESDLAAYVGGQIVGLRCLFGTKRWGPWSKGDIIGKVFLLDYDGSYPGSTILATSKEFDPVYSVYSDYNFERPYTIGAGGVLCVIEVTTPKGGGYYGAVGASNEVTTAGALWMNVGSGWEDMYHSYGAKAAGVAIQAIIVGGGNVIDAKLTNVSAKSVMVGEDILVNAKVQNLCKDPITNLEVKWSTDEGKSGTQTFTQRIAENSSADITVKVPGLATAKLHNIRIEVSSINGQSDQISENSTVDLKVPVTAHKYVRNVVCEENTGTDCGYCPRGIATFDYMKAKYPDTFIPVSLHHFPGNDPMYYTGSNYTPMFVYLNTAPAGMINRSEACYTTMFKNDVEALYLKESETCIAQITNEAYYDEATGKVLVPTHTEFGYDFSAANYRISYLVLEDKVGPYTQSNYYSYSYNQLGAMEGWEEKPANVPMMYDDVLREQLPAYTGQPGSVPTGGKGGQVYSYSYSFALPSNVKNVDNVRIVTLLLDLNTREIINASQAPLVKGIPEGIESVLAPTTDAPVYDLSGRRTRQQGGFSIVNGKKVIK